MERLQIQSIFTVHMSVYQRHIVANCSSHKEFLLQNLVFSYMIIVKKSITSDT